MDEFRQRFSLPAFFLTCLLIIHAIYAAKDRLIIGQTIRDGETLVSSGGIFELGFFTPGSSGNWYIAIRYHFFDAAIWIANRQTPTPLKNKSGVLQFTQAGRLVLLNDTGGIIWSSTTSRSVKNPVAQLLDSGNLVVRDANDDRPENFLWQSFDYPSDTYLPGMKLGWNFVTGVETYLSSWTSNDDPAPGEYTLHLDPTGFPQIVLKRDKDVLYRAAPLNGLLQPSGPQDSTSRLTLQMNKYEAYCREDTFNGSALWRSRLSQSGISQRFAWSSLSKDWFLYRSAPNPGDACDDTYNLCGAYGSCNTGNSPVCGCLDKFVPKDPQGLLRGSGSTGCIRRTP